MRIGFASILFFSLCNAAEHKLQELTIKNNSNQKITIYYHNHDTRYIILDPSVTETIQLSLPQNITVHFNKLNFQQEVNIDHTREPLLIHHENSLSLMQNGRALSPKVHFDTHRPSLTVRESS